MKCLLMIVALLLTPVICSAQQPQWQPSKQSQQTATANVVEHHHIYHVPPSYQRFGPRLTIGGCNILGINLWESGTGSFFGNRNPNVQILGAPVMSLSGGVWSGGYRPQPRTYNQYYQGSRYRSSYGSGYRGSYRGSYGGYQDRDWSDIRR